MNFVPCLLWVKKGVAKSRPDRLQLSTDELKKLAEESAANSDLNDDEVYEDEDNSSDEYEDLPSEEEDVSHEDKASHSKDDCRATEQKTDEESFEAKYNLDTYDDGDDRPFIKINDVAVYVDNKEDTYITGYDAIEEDDKEEEEDFLIKESDNLLVVGHIEEQSSVLEFHVYNKQEDTFYVHHDIVLPSYPLAMEWLDFHPAEEKPGNYVAVADMSPGIKIWDVDVVDILEPDYCLGEEVKTSKKSKKLKCQYHSDAVLSLSWNKHLRNILASGSADSSIIIWNLEDASVLHKLEFHTNKVQSLQWHPVESSFLISGCTDGLLKLFDCRSPDSECKTWNVEGEVERVLWSLSDAFKFFCTTDKGCVYSFDTRLDEAEISMQAHRDAVTGLDVCALHPNILLTASMDNTVKVWDIEQKKMLSSHKLKVGSIYAAKFSPDDDMTAAVGGNKSDNGLKILDLSDLMKAHSQKDSSTTSENKDLIDKQKVEQVQDVPTPTDPPSKKNRHSKKKDASTTNEPSHFSSHRTDSHEVKVKTEKHQNAKFDQNKTFHNRSRDSFSGGKKFHQKRNFKTEIKSEPGTSRKDWGAGPSPKVRKYGDNV